MPRHTQSPEGRVLAFFRTAPVAIAGLILGMARDLMAERRTSGVPAARKAPKAPKVAKVVKRRAARGTSPAAVAKAKAKAEKRRKRNERRQKNRAAKRAATQASSDDRMRVEDYGQQTN